MFDFLFFLLSIYTFYLLQLLHKFLIPIAELAFPIGIPTKEAQAEMKTHPLTV